jgi:predicted amidohydrolase YtcJ
MSDRIGRLEPGYCADIAVVEFDDMHMSNIYDGIFSNSSECILTIVSGKICYDKNGKFKNKLTAEHNAR